MEKERLKAPFPYPGKKSNIAESIWEHLAGIDVYIEPFCGSAAMALARPESATVQMEVLNDADGLLVNAWRSLAHAPGEVAVHAVGQLAETDMHAKHAWLLERKRTMLGALEADIHYYDAMAAGYWLWLHGAWAVGAPCRGKGPWVQTAQGIVLRSDTGMLQSDYEKEGMIRQVPYLNRSGHGVLSKKLRRYGPEHHRAQLLEWFTALQQRFYDTTILAGNWDRPLSDFLFSGSKGVGIFFDPPYSDSKGTARSNHIYASESMTIDHEVREWCIAHTPDKRLHMVLCGYGEVHDDLLNYGWSKHAWKGAVGYSNTGGPDTPGMTNRLMESYWISPQCQSAQLSLFGA